MSEREGCGAPLSLKVFISSPGDVTEERTIARSVLRELEKEPQFQGRVMLQEISWDDPDRPAAMEANLSFQRAIDKGLPMPSQCDVVVVILWSRLGSEIKDEAHGRPGGGQYTGTEWEFHDAARAADCTGLPKLWVYRRRMAVSYLPGDSERAEKRGQEDLVETFFAGPVKSFHWHAPPPGLAAESTGHRGDKPFDKLLSGHLREYVWQRLQGGVHAHPTVGTANPQAVWPAGRSPFRGLEPFTAEYAPVFRGRDAEVADLLNDVAAKPFVAILGLSGSGKSSLVYAGLFPALAAGQVPGSDDWRMVSFKPRELSGGPMESLASALVAAFPARGWRTGTLTARLRAAPDEIGTVVADALGGARRLVLFIDQFEEVFADATAADADGGAFFAMLRAAAECGGRMRVVIAMRSDFYGHWPQDEASIALLNAGQRTLGTPRAGALECMIREPAGAAGLTVPDRLVRRILDEAGDGANTLPLVEFVLNRLFELRDGREFTLAAYDSFGGLPGAIERLAEEAIAGNTGDDGWAESGARALAADEASRKHALARLFQAIVSVSDSGGQRAGVRLRAPAAALDHDDEVRALAECLLKKRLLVRGGGEQQTAYLEVAHEALFSHWPRLATWLKQFGEALQVLHHVDTEARAWKADPSNRLHQPWPAEAQQVAYDALAKLGRRWDTEPEPLRAFLRPEAECLQDELQDINTPHRRRAEIGDRLASIGDPRTGVGVRDDGVPDIDWVSIQAGCTCLRDPRWPDVVSFPVAANRISRYPVTWRQYRAFLEAEDGYHCPVWWVPWGPDLPCDEHRVEQFRKFDNCPADNVSWFEAVAFCQWLTKRLSDELPAGQVIRLPLEWEWQLAAQGGDSKREYPWGRWDAGFANTSESGLDRSVAVGMYPFGVSSEYPNLLDMSGNILEWCLNLFESSLEVRIQDIDTPRALRGGSWFGEHTTANCLRRSQGHPDEHMKSWGFRICCAAPVNDPPQVSRPVA